MAVREMAENVIRRFSSFRRNIRERIREVEQMSQREVMSTAHEVNNIYSLATTQISNLKARLSTLSHKESKPDRSSAEEQLLSVEAHMRNMDSRILALKNIAGQASSVASKIAEAALQINQMTNHVQMLADGAGAEATQGPGDLSAGFTAITAKVKDLSQWVVADGHSVQTLSTQLGSILPHLDSGISELRAQSQSFTSALRKDIRDLAAESLSQRKVIAEALAKSDEVLGSIIASSRNALSHMQFQDAISQGLMRLDAVALENEVALHQELGMEDRIDKLEPAMHVEIGGDKAVDQKKAGEVILF